jgi:hypothetical protein
MVFVDGFCRRPVRRAVESALGVSAVAAISRAGGSGVLCTAFLRDKLSPECTWPRPPVTSYAGGIHHTSVLPVLSPPATAPAWATRTRSMRGAQPVRTATWALFHSSRRTRTLWAGHQRRSRRRSPQSRAPVYRLGASSRRPTALGARLVSGPEPVGRPVDLNRRSDGRQLNERALGGHLFGRLL